MLNFIDLTERLKFIDLIEKQSLGNFLNLFLVDYFQLIILEDLIGI